MKQARIFPFLAAGALALLLPHPADTLERVGLRLADGAPAELADSLRASSVLASLQGRADVAVDEVVAAAQADYARLVEVLYAQGYYAVVVNIRLDGREAALIDPFRLPPQVRAADISVDPGRLFRFGNVRIAPLAGNRPLPAGFRRDAPALADVVREAAQTGVAGWRQAGHAKAQVSSHSVLARHGPARLDVAATITPGPRVRFGKSVVAGKSAVRPDRIRAIAGIPSGVTFHPDVADQAAARLRRTGTFKSVQVRESDSVAPDGTMDMQITVVDQKPRRIGGGLEYSSFDGVTLSGYWLHRNLLGGAERFRIDGEVAQIDGTGRGTDYTLTFRLERPAVYGPDTQFFAEAGVYYLDEPDFIEEKAELMLGVTREFNPRLTGELGIGYSFSRVTDLYAVPKTRRELQVLSLPAALIFDTRDDPLDATRGSYLRGEITPFYEIAGGSAGAQVKFDLRTYRALGARAEGENGTVLAGRLQLGALTGPGAASAPPGYLFYSGGGGTVRGQPYKSLGASYGPVMLGGQSFAALSGELRVPMNARLGLVAFADAGFVGAGLFDDGDWHAGAGLGARYKTPVGPLRIDVAGPVAGSTGNGLQLYVGIGQAF